MDLNEPVRWLLGRGTTLLVGAFVLLLIYRIGVRAIHRFVPLVITAQATQLPTGSSSADEVDKRIGTVEDLLLKLLRMAVLAGVLGLALAVFELWAILVAIVLLIVAIVFATQDVVLDYAMGFMILVEGPFFKDDYVVIRDHPGAEGVVEEIGLRRTILRDAFGSSHAVSNGYIRLSSNLTRLFSVAVVEFHVLHARELDRALATATRVTNELREDTAWADRFLAEPPTDLWVTGLGTDGAAIRIQQRVATGAHLAVASELRRRLAAELAAESIATGRWDTPMPIVSHASVSQPRAG
jgi:small-conductance mechanosensitive channel